MIATGVVGLLFWLVALASAIRSGGSKALNALVVTGEIGFLAAFPLLVFTEYFNPRVRKWCRRLAWLLAIAGVIALVIDENIHPWSAPPPI